MSLTPDKFLEQTKKGILIDVRSPGEFAKGRIHGAINFPLFSNEERAIIGTAYKKEGKDIAVKLGLEIIGPRMASMVDEAQSLSQGQPISIYCWRGGMRSNSLAWLLTTAGMKVSVLEGGYKAYRTFLSTKLINEGTILVLGGYTGSAKTHILQLMHSKGAQIIDLEGLAKHKGSAFGNLDEDKQPEVEEFVNLLGEQFMQLDTSKPIWCEDESRTIGSVWLPEDFYHRLRNSNVIAIKRTRLERATFLAKDYGAIDREKLKFGFSKIERRLGGQNVKDAHESVDNGDLITAADIALSYYDKTYEHGLTRRDSSRLTRIDMTGKTHEEIADYLLSKQGSWI